MGKNPLKCEEAILMEGKINWPWLYNLADLNGTLVII